MRYNRKGGSITISTLITEPTSEGNISKDHSDGNHGASSAGDHNDSTAPSTAIEALSGGYVGKESRSMFELTIENTGIGITSEESAKIGSALFYRGEHARKAHSTGMGIGLSVVKAIVKAHHGTFSIESKGRGNGARVVVGVPR